MTKNSQEKKRRFIDEAQRKLAGIVYANGSAERLSVPADGAIKWVREGLGKTRKTVAARMEISSQSLAGIEKAEAEGTVRLDTLRRAALALNCTVV